MEQQRQVGDVSRACNFRMPFGEPADAGAGGEEPERQKLTPTSPRQDGRGECRAHKQAVAGPVIQ
jgi:hypothetical protein